MLTYAAPRARALTGTNGVIDFELRLAMADMNRAVDALQQVMLKAKARGVGWDAYDDNIAKAIIEFKSVSDRIERIMKRRGVEPPR
jgi:hypothetical protein